MVEDIDATIDEIADEAGTGKAAYSFKYAAAEMLLKARNERDAYIRETGKYARECGLQDAEIGRLKERAEKAEAERDVLARRCMEDNTSLEYGFEFPEGFTPRFEPETGTHAVKAWIEWAAREASASDCADSAKSERGGEI